MNLRIIDERIVIISLTRYFDINYHNNFLKSPMPPLPLSFNPRILLAFL